jgi:hypothetical protein
MRTKTKLRSKRRKRKTKKKDSWQLYEEGRTRLINGLIDLKDEMKHSGFDVKITNTWGTYIITPKINVKFIQILRENHFTIEQEPFANSAQNTLLLQDMRKRPYTKMPRNKDFNIKLAIKLSNWSDEFGWRESSEIRYDDSEIDEELD